MTWPRESRRMAKHTLVYPWHILTPEELLNFGALDWFSRNWRNLKLDAEDDLAHLQSRSWPTRERGILCQELVASES